MIDYRLLPFIIGITLVSAALFWLTLLIVNRIFARCNVPYKISSEWHWALGMWLFLIVIYYLFDPYVGDLLRQGIIYLLLISSLVWILSGRVL